MGSTYIHVRVSFRNLFKGGGGRGGHISRVRISMWRGGGGGEGDHNEVG